MKILIFAALLIFSQLARAEATKQNIDSLHSESVECMMWFSAVIEITDGAARDTAGKSVKQLAKVIDELPVDRKITEAKMRQWLAQWQGKENYMALALEKYGQRCARHMSTLQTQLEEIKRVGK